MSSETDCRTEKVRAMAQNNREEFLEYAKKCFEDNQMWRSIYQTWSFRHASNRDLVPRDVDEWMVDRMIEKEFSEHLVKNEEVLDIAKQLSIELTFLKKD